MQLFEHDPRTGLERLTDNADIRYATCLEAQTIWSIAGGELDGVRRGIDRAVNACFIKTADKEALDEYDEYFDIHHETDRDLEEQRNEVRAWFMRVPHIGDPEIQELMSCYTDGAVFVELIGGCVNIHVTLPDTEQRFDTKPVYKLLRLRFPGHLGIFFETLKTIEGPDIVVSAAAYGTSVFITELEEREKTYDYEHGTAYAGATGGFYGVNELPQREPDFRFGYGAAVGVRGTETAVINLPDLTPAQWEV